MPPTSTEPSRLIPPAEPAVPGGYSMPPAAVQISIRAL
jgi:hypothetical protein